MAGTLAKSMGHENLLLLSVVMPCYNERDTIVGIVDAVLSQAVKPIELVIVDDGSTDGTREILSSLAGRDGVRVIMHDYNRGKGAALRTALASVRGTIVLVQDADLEYDPREYQRLIEPIVTGKAAVVYGSRFMGGGPHRVVYFWHMVGNRVLTLLSNMMTNINLTDMETCYKVFRRDVVDKISIEEDRFGFEPEITAKVARLGVPIYEIGISYFGRTYSEGKKIGWRDGIRAVYAILKYNLFR
jgi:glycosyltransferase involved in cell wall biosynthesis